MAPFNSNKTSKGHGNIFHVDIMPFIDYKNNKLNREEARKLVLKIASTGRVILTAHATKRLSERRIIFNDVLNVLLSQSMRISEGETQSSGYTYRCSTKKFVVVVSFTIRGDGIVVITVFKTERKE
jgi:hypothetical protein